MLAARTGALCIGTERTVEAIRRAGSRSSTAGRTTVSRPEAVERLDASGLAPGRRGQGLRARRGARADRAERARRRRRPPPAQRPRARRLHPSVRCRSSRPPSSRQGASAASRRSRPSRASSSSERPGRAITAASGDARPRDAREQRSSRCASRASTSSSADDERARPLGEGRTARGARSRDGRVRDTRRRAARATPPGVARVRAGARRGMRRGAAPTASSSIRPGNGRSSRPCPTTSLPSAARDAVAGRPDGARRDHRLGRPRRPAARCPDADARRAAGRRARPLEPRRMTTAPVGRWPHDADRGAVATTRGEPDALVGSSRRRASPLPTPRRRHARPASVRVVRLGLRPRDLLAVRLAARAPARAVQHDQPPHAARRPRRAGHRAARSARDARRRRARDPRRRSRSRSRRRRRFSTSSRASTARAAGSRRCRRCCWCASPVVLRPALHDFHPETLVPVLLVGGCLALAQGSHRLVRGHGGARVRDEGGRRAHVRGARASCCSGRGGGGSARSSRSRPPPGRSIAVYVVLPAFGNAAEEEFGPRFAGDRGDSFADVVQLHACCTR